MKYKVWLFEVDTRSDYNNPGYHVIRYDIEGKCEVLSEEEFQDFKIGMDAEGRGQTILFRVIEDEENEAYSTKIKYLVQKGKEYKDYLKDLEKKEEEKKRKRAETREKNKKEKELQKLKDLQEKYGNA